MDKLREYRGYRDLAVYQLSYKCALQIHEVTKSFPNEERYSLTDQVRRSSRGIPAIIAEAWKKRLYVKAFVSKLSDASTEQAETTVWLDFARDLGYIDEELHAQLSKSYDEVGAMLHSMMNNPKKFTW